MRGSPNIEADRLSGTFVALYTSGRSLPQIATETGVPMSTVRLRIIAHGGTLRSRSDGVRLAAPRISATATGKVRGPFSAEHRARIAAARRAAPARGFTIGRDGYVRFTRGPHKNRLVHDVLAEIKLGRPLHPHECVHHRDHDRQNNLDENLQVMTRAEHARIHAVERMARRSRDSLGRFGTLPDRPATEELRRVA